MQELKSIVKTELSNHIQKLIASGGEAFYCYGIQIDNDSFECFAKANRLSDIEFEPDSFDYDMGKYYVGCWADDHVQPMSALNARISVMLKEGATEESLEPVFDAIIESLLEVRNEGAFSNQEQRPFYVVKLFDEERNPHTLKSLRMLNTEEQIVEIAAGMGYEVDEITGVESPVAMFFEAVGIDGTERAIKLLNDNPGLVRETRMSGRTPLHQAAFCGNLPVAKRAIELGANLNATNECGFTPLFYACASMEEAVGLLLIESGCDVTKRDKSGLAALHLAADMGKTEVARGILNQGGDVNVVDESGDSPLDVAIRQGWPPMVDFLKKRGAKPGSTL